MVSDSSLSGPRFNGAGADEVELTSLPVLQVKSPPTLNRDKMPNLDRIPEAMADLDAQEVPSITLPKI